LIEPRFLDIERIDLAVPNLPGEWEGATVAFISDFQQRGTCSPGRAPWKPSH
jgi:hypothetical protein